MKRIQQHKVILAVILVSIMGSGCALLGPLMGMLGGGLALDGEEASLYMTNPDTVAQKLGYQWATSGKTEKNGAFLYGAYRGK